MNRFIERPLITSMLAVLCMVLAGCTIVREVDNNDDGGEGNQTANHNDVGTVFNDIPADGTIVDAVVFVELTQAGAGISDGYHAYLNEVETALAAQGVFVRDLAVAPLYRQHDHRPPLLYGRGADNNLQPSLQQTLAYYLTDAGRGHLDQRVDAPGENPAALGMELDREPIFNPEEGPGDGSPYFREPEDGFVAFYITGTARDCGHGDTDCAIDGSSPAEYFTDTDADGEANWLSLPAEGLAPDDIVHVSVATDEGVDYDSFHSSCDRRPDFPTRYFDFLEPSEHNLYFEPFADQLENNGGVARNADMCAALSSELDGSATTTANTIASAVR